MKKLFKKSLVIIMVVVMTLTAAPLSGFVGLDLPSLFKSEAAGFNSITYMDPSGIIYYFGDNYDGTVVFEGSPSEISNLIIPSTFSKNGKTYLVTHIDSACGIRDSVTSVTIPNSVKFIGYTAFAYNENLIDVTFGNGVEIIGAEAFIDCDSLTSVTIPNSITGIGVKAFMNCDSLTDVTIGYGVTGETTICEYAFADCDSLKRIRIPGNVSAIAAHAFSGCDNLISVTLGNGVNTIGNCAFQKCENLSYVGIPDSVTTIGVRAFSQCLSLESVIIPGSVKTIDAYAFAECRALEEVVLSYGLTTIGKSAFSSCDSLKELIIPDSVTTLGDGVFKYPGYDLKYVHIPASVTNIGSNIFNAHYRTSVYICSETKDSCAKAHADAHNINFRLCDDHNINNPTDDSNDNTTDNPNDNPNDKPTDTPTNKTYKFYNREFKHNLDYFAKNGDSSKYDPELANMLAALSAAVYKESDIKQAYKELGFDDCEVYDYDGAFNPHSAGYALAFKQTESGETICLVTVRGTNNTSDWIGNIDTRNIPGIDSGKHPGFSQPANRIYDNIQNYIDSNNITGDVKYYVTGHSRGAAVGNLLSVKLMENDVASSDVYNYNYATPDVAAKVSFPKYDNIFNVCNREDAVPHVPGIAEDVIIPDIPGTSWGKFGQTHWFTKDAPGINPIDNHDMNLYLDFMDEQTPPSEWKKTLGDSVHDAGYTASGWLGKVLCPVDVIITDKNGNKIASVIDGETNYYDSKLGNVIILTDGDKKVIYINGDNDFNVNLVGTDSGEMTYTIEQYNIQNEKVLDSKTFENVKLEKGKEMQSAVCGDKTADDVSLYVYENNNDGEKAAKYAVNTDGSEIEISEVFKGFAIKKPSTTTVNYGDTLVLCADIGDYAIPAGYAIEWLVEGAGVSTSVSEDGLECRVTSIANGNPTIYAKLVDEEENVITNANGEEIFDEITITSKGGFFWKFISFFKNLFRMNRVIY